MILYSPAKINIGLHILRKRGDGFHDLDSLIYPLPFFDLIEIQAENSLREDLSFVNSGICVPGTAESNLCTRAVRIFLKSTKTSASIKLHLHKQIPFGAGLGGGSSNASSILLAMNKLTDSQLNKDQLATLAAQLGSDCPAFIYETPVMVSGRGEILEESNVELAGYFMLLLNPGIVVPTAEAYSLVKSNRSRAPLSQSLLLPPKEWKEHIFNDFEDTVFARHPEIKKLKDSLYILGAVFASMSGSGSSVYGLYKERPTIPDEINKMVLWNGWL